MVEEPRFRELILADASAVKARQETDSIDIVDEIRFFLKTDLNSVAAIEETARKMELFSDFLLDLGFDV